ncbi:MAG: four helix bundle protein [Elusimicrobiota bacterium]
MAEETSVMQVIPKLVDFIEWIIPALDKFPKSRKFLLADRIETGLLDVLGKLIEANYSREKLVLLRKANLQLEKIRYLLRIAYRLRCFDVRCQDATRPGHGSFMKTHRHLFDRIIAFPNLLLASKLAQRGKRFRYEVARFNFGLEREMLKLQEELISGKWTPGAYHNFTVYEPKERPIVAAPYRDRVVHHALCNVIEPIFEAGFMERPF